MVDAPGAVRVPDIRAGACLALLGRRALVFRVGPHAGAGRAVRPLTGSGEDGEENGGQNGDDGNHDEQFDEREPALAARSHGRNPPSQRWAASPPTVLFATPARSPALAKMRSCSAGGSKGFNTE